MKNKLLISVMSLCLLLGCKEENGLGDQNSKEQIIHRHITAYSKRYGLAEYWKNPGKYMAINALDGNLKTCFARGGEHPYFKKSLGSNILKIDFHQHIKVDTIKIAAGCFFNTKYYKLNNRLKDIKLSFYSFNDSYHESFRLKDIMHYQVLKLKDAYRFSYVVFNVESLYQGLKYDDTCISDIKFYYKGKEVVIKNIDRIKEGERWSLISFFERDLFLMLNRGSAYCYGNSLTPSEFIFTSDGKFRINSDDYDERISFFKEVKRWKVVDGRFFLLVKNKWQLVDYRFDDRHSEFTCYIYKVGNKNLRDEHGRPLNLENTTEKDEEDRPVKLENNTEQDIGGCSCTQ